MVKSLDKRPAMVRFRSAFDQDRGAQLNRRDVRDIWAEIERVRNDAASFAHVMAEAAKLLDSSEGTPLNRFVRQAEQILRNHTLTGAGPFSAKDVAPEPCAVPAQVIRSAEQKADDEKWQAIDDIEGGDALAADAEVW